MPDAALCTTPGDVLERVECTYESRKQTGKMECKMKCSETESCKL